ncbi:ATP-dependent Clp protease adaptor ClpS [Fulvivirga sp. M361]|uniref:ATP-dependent Clp protease adaptor ClpS n=1 Tax=Fulvivirga sp. M361 TaxID=2594266 RepID=UPI00117A8DA4|nr:ATP-dependent Clp protease adaptor ClpS [Fulvivirga sp. M361]TRX53085.1 ATP-dependent Clp protease adaptor ClpS [Fulvivirga sp. M361]
MSFGYEEQELVELLEEADVTDVKDLMVFNDDVNTFDHVINTLIRVCNHSAEQAEQCAMIIHYRGKCSVKKGEFKFLKPMQEAICDAGIDARVV